MTRERRLAGTTGALAALLALLALYAYFGEVRGGARRERAQEASAHLLQFRPEAVTELVIQRPGERIVCRKEQGRWRLTVPIRSAADDTTLTRILTDLSESRIERTVAEHPAALAPFGLEHPAILTVTAGARPQSIAVGKPNPAGSFVFAQRQPVPHQSLPVLLVEGRLRDAVEMKLYDLRDKTMLDFSPEEVTAITFTNHGRTTRLIHLPAGKGKTPAGWQLADTRRVRADRSLIERSLNLVSRLNAEQFVSESSEHLGQYGLDPPWGSARFDLKGRSSQQLLLGRKTVEGALPRYFARQPGTGPVFTINENLPRDVAEKPEAWRERHVTDFVRADVAELRLISPDRTVVCARRGTANNSNWGVAEFVGHVAEGMNLGAAARMPSEQPANRDRVEDLVAHLGTLEAAAFLDNLNPGEHRFGLTPAALKVVAMDKDGKLLATVSFGARSGGRCYATSSYLGGLYLIQDSDVNRFRLALKELAARS
jgi:hypothetical protein